MIWLHRVSNSPDKSLWDDNHLGKWALTMQTRHLFALVVFSGTILFFQIITYEILKKANRVSLLNMEPLTTRSIDGGILPENSNKLRDWKTNKQEYSNEYLFQTWESIKMEQSYILRRMNAEFWEVIVWDNK